MRNLPPRDDGMPAFVHAVQRADRQRAELGADLLVHRGGCGKQPVTAAAEGLQQGAVGKIADDFRMQIVMLQPGVDVRAQRMATRGQEQRRAVEAARESGSQAPLQCLAAVERHVGLADQAGLQL